MRYFPFILKTRNPNHIQMISSDINLFIFLDMWEKDHKIEPGLPGHPYGPRQLFWIALAQV